VLRQVSLCGQKAHAETAGIVETEFEIAAELEDEMIVRSILLPWRAYPETTGHTEVQEQDVFWLQVDEEIFGASIHPRDGAADGVFLQRWRVDELPEAWLPYPYASDLTTSYACGQTTSDGFHFW
jgi:hypothetical protein